MKQQVSYRQMELNPRIADGEMHSPEQMRQQVEQARQQVEFYEAQRVQWEAQSRELEANTQKKLLFNDTLNEIGMKLHNAVRRIDKELESMQREQAEIEQINECLKRHLQILSAMKPENWSTEGFSNRLQESMPKLDRAINDFEETYSGPGRYRHTDIFRHKPGVEERQGIDWAGIRNQLVKGFYFHLPLFLLLLITWGVCTLISHI